MYESAVTRLQPKNEHWIDRSSVGPLSMWQTLNREDAEIRRRNRNDRESRKQQRLESPVYPEIFRSFFSGDYAAAGV
jgi:hypothetical protein